MMMRRLPDLAIRECLGEFRAACRLPVDDSALDALVERLRHNFEQILAHADGPRRWADHGQRMRDNARHLGALADFYGNKDGFVAVDAIERAFAAVRQDCTVRAESTPLAFQYCVPPPDGGGLPEDATTGEVLAGASAPVRARERV